MSLFKQIQTGIALVILTVCFSCEYINNLTDTGTLISEKRAVGEIKHITANAPCRILLHNTESNQILIEGYDNLVENLDIIYRDNSLIINHKNKNYIQKSKLIEVVISAKHLKSVTANMAIEMKGKESICLDDLTMVINGRAKFSEIDLDVHTSNIALHVYGDNIGNFHLSGESHSSTFALEGSVNIDALDLICDQSYIIHKSIGYCKVTAESELDVKSYSSGNTYYIGDAKVVLNHINVPYMRSCGEVIKLN